MTKGLLFVESRPSSPDQADVFHRWHIDKHYKEMLQLEGFISVERFEPLDGEGSFVSIYHIDTEPETAQATLLAALQSGTMAKPEGVQLDPPPKMRFMRLLDTHG